MNTSTAARRQALKKDELRTVGFAEFWRFSANRVDLNDSERLLQIKMGFSAHLFQAVRMTFNLHERSVETLLNASISTLERRMREQKNLDPVASERLDRIAAVSHLAEEVFESQELASQWMSKANKALGGGEPILLCETEIGAKQVRRVLHALEWGGAA
jgi:putative toxin-antitoxin system antitoxin component (TIGR02293 family)